MMSYKPLENCSPRLYTAEASFVPPRGLLTVGKQASVSLLLLASAAVLYKQTFLSLDRLLEAWLYDNNRGPCKQTSRSLDRLLEAWLYDDDGGPSPAATAVFHYLFLTPCCVLLTNRCCVHLFDAVLRVACFWGWSTDALKGDALDSEGGDKVPKVFGNSQKIPSQVTSIAHYVRKSGGKPRMLVLPLGELSLYKTFFSDRIYEVSKRVVTHRFGFARGVLFCFFRKNKTKLRC